MKKFSLGLLTKKSVLTILIFFVIFFALFYKLGTYPNFFAPVVEHTIHPAVIKVLDNVDVSDKVTWRWTDMHLHGGFRSPVYIATITTGLRLFGFNLFGVRVVGALITFFSLIVFYHSVKKHFGQRFSLIFLILLASTPWFLVFQRSGGVINISLSLVLLGLSAVMLMFKSKDELSLLSFCGGLVIALFPYGYVIIRVVALILIFLVLIGYFSKSSRFKLKHVFLFLLPITCAIFIQVRYFHTDISSFFYARGESIAAQVNEYNSGIGMKEIVNKVTQNTVQQLKILSGDYFYNAFGKSIIVQNYWSKDIIVYPKFLVPFFLLGIILLVTNIIKKHSLIALLFLLLLPTTLIPGTFSWIGAPNPTRNYIAIIPIYFCITYAVDIVFFHKSEFLKKHLKVGSVLAIVGVFLVVGVVFYQLHNYFYYEREVENYLKNETEDALKFVLAYTDDNDSSRVIYHEREVFSVYSNTLVRYLGKDKMQRLINDGRIVFVNSKNIINILGTLNNYDILVSSSAKRSDLDNSELSNYRSTKYGRATVYYLHRPIMFSPLQTYWE